MGALYIIYYKLIKNITKNFISFLQLHNLQQNIFHDILYQISNIKKGFIMHTLSEDKIKANQVDLTSFKDKVFLPNSIFLYKLSKFLLILYI